MDKLTLNFHVFELFKNQFKKTKGLFELIEQFSRGDFKTIRGVRIIRVFELIGNLPYILNLISLGHTVLEKCTSQDFCIK